MHALQAYRSARGKYDKAARGFVELCGSDFLFLVAGYSIFLFAYTLIVLRISDYSSNEVNNCQRSRERPSGH